MFKSFIETTNEGIVLAIFIMIFFFVIFIGVVFYVLRLKKSFINNASRLPLDEELNQQHEYIGESNG